VPSVTQEEAYAGVVDRLSCTRDYEAGPHKVGLFEPRIATSYWGFDSPESAAAFYSDLGKGHALRGCQLLVRDLEHIPPVSARLNVAGATRVERKCVGASLTEQSVVWRLIGSGAPHIVASTRLEDFHSTPGPPLEQFEVAAWMAVARGYASVRAQERRLWRLISIEPELSCRSAADHPYVGDYEPFNYPGFLSAAVVSCRGSGDFARTYHQYSTPSDMRAAFRSFKTSLDGLACNLSHDTTSWSFYSDGSSEAGTRACRVQDDGRRFEIVTYPAKRAIQILTDKPKEKTTDAADLDARFERLPGFRPPWEE
jgi:hypothetical protein